MKPILFNTQMVQAVRRDVKTETRRLIYLPDGMTGHPIGEANNPNNPLGFMYPGGIKRPRYLPGDILYVRETFTELFYVDPDGYTNFDKSMYYYAADGTPDITLVDADGFEIDDQRIKWKPSIHMPKAAAREFLRVTETTIERLNDITIEGIRNEGIRLSPREEICTCTWEESGCRQEPCANRDAYLPSMYISKFVRLWDSTIKEDRYLMDSWEANPWVWVYKFERCEKPEVSHGHDRETH